MNIKEWTKQFWFKVLNKIEDHVAAVMAGVIISIISVLYVIFGGWLKSTHSLTIYGWVWLLLLLILLFLTAYFIYHTLREKARLKNEHDIINAIDYWFKEDDSYGASVEKDVNYYFSYLEKDLNLTRGSSRRYLPMIACIHGYAFEVGKRTFKLTNLTPEKDPSNLFEKLLKPIFNGKETEVLLSCKDIDAKLGWPEGAIKAWLLSRPQSNEDFYTKYEGGDKIRFIKK